MNTNLSEVLSNIGQGLKTIMDPNYLLRPLAIETIPLMTERIHKEGKASDGGQIGTYSNGYLKVRSGQFRNAGKKNSGVKTKQRVATPFGSLKYVYLNIEGDKIKRENYNRGSDTKVIVSLTRQLENNWSVMETQKGYGIGFTNPFNADKLRWVEEQKGKVIGHLTTEELEYVSVRLNELVADALSK